MVRSKQQADTVHRIEDGRGAHKGISKSRCTQMFDMRNIVSPAPVFGAHRLTQTLIETERRLERQVARERPECVPDHPGFADVNRDNPGAYITQRVQRRSVLCAGAADQRDTMTPARQRTNETVWSHPDG
jgi:hypothetical protein